MEEDYEMIQGCADKSLNRRKERRNKRINSALPDSLNITAIRRQLHASEPMNRFRPILAGWCLWSSHQMNGEPLFTQCERFSCAHPATESSKIERLFFSLPLPPSLPPPLSLCFDWRIRVAATVRMRNMQIGSAVLPVVSASTRHHHHHHHHHHRRRHHPSSWKFFVSYQLQHAESVLVVG